MHLFKEFIAALVCVAVITQINAKSIQLQSSRFKRDVTGAPYLGPNPCANTNQQYFPADASFGAQYFIECSNNEPFIFKCPAQLVWNQQIETCDYDGAYYAGATVQPYGGYYAQTVIRTVPSSSYGTSQSLVNSNSYGSNEKVVNVQSSSYQQAKPVQSYQQVEQVQSYQQPKPVQLIQTAPSQVYGSSTGLGNSLLTSISSSSSSSSDLNSQMLLRNVDGSQQQQSYSSVSSPVTSYSSVSSPATSYSSVSSSSYGGNGLSQQQSSYGQQDSSLTAQLKNQLNGYGSSSLVGSASASSSNLNDQDLVKMLKNYQQTQQPTVQQPYQQPRSEQYQQVITQPKSYQQQYQQTNYQSQKPTVQPYQSSNYQTSSTGGYSYDDNFHYAITQQEMLRQGLTSNPCANNDQQYFPASKGPHFFIECSNRIPYLFECPANLVWNQQILTCDYDASYYGYHSQPTADYSPYKFSQYHQQPQLRTSGY